MLSLAFFASTLVLALEVIAPPGIKVVMLGSGVEVLDIPGVYSRTDVVVVAASAFTAGATAAAILLKTLKLPRERLG